MPNLFQHVNQTMLLPITIGLTLIITLIYFRMRLVRNRKFEKERWLRYQEFQENAKKSDKPSAIQKLIHREDVTLRLLEEVFEIPGYWKGIEWGSTDVMRLRRLDSLKEELRNYLRSSIDSESFTIEKDRIISLLDEIKHEVERLQHKEPFNDIHDPERSLLIDIFSEIHPDRVLVKQKALQLANIIKIKHQDIANLQSQNAKAAGWTKFGTAGTVFFGLLSLILSIMAIKR